MSTTQRAHEYLNGLGPEALYQDGDSFRVWSGLVRQLLTELEGAQVETQYLVIHERQDRDTLRGVAFPERERAEYSLLFGGVLIREERITTPWREVERLETADGYRARMDAQYAAEDAEDAASGGANG